MKKPSNEIIANVLIRIGRTTTAAEIADMIGALDTASYLALRQDWKADYAALSQEIRAAKAAMRLPGDRSSEQSTREALRFQAFRMMVVRGAVSELGRRHWASRKALAA